MSICVSPQGPALSSASPFLQGGPSQGGSAPDSALLGSIRAALRGYRVDVASVRSSLTASAAACDAASPKEVELSWNAYRVTLCEGGVLRAKWDFEDYGQPIQWACIGWLEQASDPHGHVAAYHHHHRQDYDEVPLPPPSGSTEKPTFGPFAEADHDKRIVPEDDESPVRAVFVFLRSIGKIFLMNGVDYTFGLPFIVQKAWPLHPHGVMLQRVLEPNEKAEAELSGDITLPTIFSITSPYSEPCAVAVTRGIVHGFSDIPAALEDEDEDFSKPLNSVPATEMVISVTSRDHGVDHHDITVTIDVDKRQLTVWRYAYVKPKDLPLPLARSGDSSEGGSSKPRPRSSLMAELVGSIERINPAASYLSREGSPAATQLPPRPSYPGIIPALSTATTMASLVSGVAQPPPPLTQKSKGRRNSLARNDLSVTMDRMVLGGRADMDSAPPIDHGRMRSAHWMETLYSEQIPEQDADSWQNVTVALFDHRFDGKVERSLLGICFPRSQNVFIFSLSHEDDKVKLSQQKTIIGVSITVVRATRDTIYDLLVVKPDGSLVVLTHGLNELPLQIGLDSVDDGPAMEVDEPSVQTLSGNISHRKIMSVQDAVGSSVTLVFEDGAKTRCCLDFVAQDPLTALVLRCFANVLPEDLFFQLHRSFIEEWSACRFRVSDGEEFDCFVAALSEIFQLPDDSEPPSWKTAWDALSHSSSSARFQDDKCFRMLQFPPPSPTPLQPPASLHSSDLYTHLTNCLYALHLLGEELRLQVHRYQCVLRLAPVICRVAQIVKPEWSDYWKRLCPDAIPGWPSHRKAKVTMETRLPVWPPDMSAMLYCRMSDNELKAPLDELIQVVSRLKSSSSYAFGHDDATPYLRKLTNIYDEIADTEARDIHQRAQNSIQLMLQEDGNMQLDKLPIGIAIPLHEASRTCRLSPPKNWSVAGYRAIGRDDLAASAQEVQDIPTNDGYISAKDRTDASRSRKTLNSIIKASTVLAAGELDVVSGVELGLEDFTRVRFGQDRRLEEVARMLCSSNVSTIKIMERPDLNEHDQAKEQQHQVQRMAERTLSLPYGRAIFTFGILPTVTKEAYSIPKLEYAVRIHQNVIAVPEPGKIPQDCLNWGEFHNGVAAGLRISSKSSGVESSWIAFNKPSELTPEHAGFLYGLGLTGHLRELLTWHTFGYLTPKHDLTSIAVLLGLSAANIGNGNRHVTKLLAVHTPAFLPTPSVDLNVSLMTQAAGLAGVGLLYMGTKNRRMAEVCLNQISRKDLVQPDLSNEHREAYTYAAGLAFGMIMLGKGSSVPADLALTLRLRVLVHGDARTLLGTSTRPPFDINLTSPAATIALGLMYLRTGRQDVADMLIIPDTDAGLHRVQPSFLLVRTIAKSLIIWDSIAPTKTFIKAQLPVSIAKAVRACWQGKPVDDAYELAYFNILAGCCFAVALKYAGTADQQAYMMLIAYFDMYSRWAYSASTTFDHKIKRSAVREGLNLISISLSMVMAGTGEINCFRRLRHAYGMQNQAFRYGTHVATHLALGLLFLGCGRFTLGTSDAAIACMVTAFFPRSHHVSSDNKSYLQALRHLWVLAVEPRCLIARDVDTNEVVYLPVKVTAKEGAETKTTQLISPTLIPELDKLVSVRVDTPRYWPFYLDIEHNPRHKECLLRHQTLYVKRRSAYLSYTEDPRGSRSLFVRSGSSSGDAATLDFPQSTDISAHAAGNLSQFISSFSNNVLFLSFADHFSRDSGDTPEEQVFHRYCYAALLDCLLHDKPQTMQQYLTLFQYRTMSPRSPYFQLRLQDLRFAANFYSKVYERRFGSRISLVRANSISATLHTLDTQLDIVRQRPDFIRALGQYARGELLDLPIELAREMAWYLIRNSVPSPTLLVILRNLAADSHMQCLGAAPPGGTTDASLLDRGIKEVLHTAGSKTIIAIGAGWSVRSVNEIISVWKQ